MICKDKGRHDELSLCARNLCSGPAAIFIKYVLARETGEFMKITYIAPMESGPRSHLPIRQRAEALSRLGHEIFFVDPWSWVTFGEYSRRWIHHAGGFGLNSLISKRLYNEVAQSAPDLIFINQGEFLNGSTISRLREIDVPIVVYINDDPFGGRDGNRFSNLIKALPYYDLVVVVREPNVEEALRFGARKVIRVWMSADEVAHAPHSISVSERSKFESDVSLIGIWMHERGLFVSNLIRRGVPLSIWGDHWEKDENWKVIKKFWKGPKLYEINDYRAAILCSKVCLGVLSRQNRDLHTTRSIEIPLVGGLLCAERTSEHLQMYIERSEAFFWKDCVECAQICHEILENSSLRKEVARRGQIRASHSPFLNEKILKHIIEKAFV